MTLMPADDATATQWLDYILEQPFAHIAWALNRALQADADLWQPIDDAIGALNAMQRHVKAARATAQATSP